MSIFSKIMNAIFSHPASAGTAAQPAGAAGAGTPSSSTQPGQAPAQNVDVSAVLTELASKNKEKLDWRKSIVDLMKLLGLDSSQKARQDLAKELGYSGDMNDSAKMNVWLHKQVMTKLAQNGGKVPAELH